MDQPFSPNNPEYNPSNSPEAQAFLEQLPNSEFDPLEQRQELPTLFPEEQRPTPSQTLTAPTIVERPKKKKRRTVWKVLGIVGKVLLSLILAVLVLVLGLVGYLSVTEYNPAYAEMAQQGTVNSKLKVSDRSLRILAFNTGYGALGAESDFFMDGGATVHPASKELVEGNLSGIERTLSECDADIYLLQEVDSDSGRSFHENQWLRYEHYLEDYESRFALNYSCNFVPYPVTDPIGNVHSGIATYSRFDITSATRYSLPCPHAWPVRTANLKRCLLVTRIPMEDSEQELVVINVHLEAYDDGSGKAEQTKQLMELMETEYAKGNYVIAGGDFNQTFPGAERSYPQKESSQWEPGKLTELPDGWQYAFDDFAPTSRLLNEPYDPDSELTQYYVIDGFILSPNITVERVETLDEGFAYTDHNPVLLDITLNGE